MRETRGFRMNTENALQTYEKCQALKVQRYVSLFGSILYYSDTCTLQYDPGGCTRTAFYTLV